MPFGFQMGGKIAEKLKENIFWWAGDEELRNHLAKSFADGRRLNCCGKLA